MATATLHPGISAAIERCETRYDNRDATIDALNDLTGVDWIVNAEPATRLVNDEPLWSNRSCAHDTSHGRGTCAVEGSDELLCPDCATALVRLLLAVNAQINIEVML
jgi:hypothetical protein